MAKSVGLLALIACVWGVTGPYWLGYDCPDGCCHREEACADLPGSLDSEATYKQLEGCLAAVPPECGIDAHVSFVAAGMDVYYYAVDADSNSTTLAATFADAFHVFPQLIVDDLGDLAFDKAVGANCTTIDTCVLFGLRRFEVICAGPDMTGLVGRGQDILLGSWYSSQGDTAARFNSHPMNYEYNSLIFSLGPSCQLSDLEGTSAWALISGVLKNVKKDQLVPTTQRLGDVFEG